MLPAVADPYSSWPFGSSQYSSSHGQILDRSAARNWERNPPLGSATISGDNVAATQAAIKKYSKIVASGGWKGLPKGELAPGASGKAVDLLRRRLQLTGDLSPRGGGYGSYGYYLQEAVARFQKRHGLTPNGVVDAATWTALNVPAKARLRQLRVNLSRLRQHSRAAAGKYVMVNIPAAQLEVVENGRIIGRHAVVVGKRDRRTPILKSRVHAVNFNPFWTIPKSIVRKDLVPKARQYSRRGKDVLSKFKIKAFDGNGRRLDPQRINWFSANVYNYTYRQDPWEDNSMGFVKISFHNAHSVYMHDTPSKSLFGRNFRANSSGCVRVQNVEKLVSWLLADTPGWDGGRVEHMKRSGERLDVNLRRPVPVYFVYVTAWANRNSVVNFRRDLYRRDGVGALASAY